ncbi:hypothetical protein PRIPAC_78189 [Pristionchus pacificus]|uniref:Uncharacterized protein n=1 Tax=Pristionchus pacificus TaxID=54126 RepID=A0A454XS20_PRIPA|nr:hypothetical protein PRIPAC_78189 [Pristionchus pacificus]|eukprot:PDM78425.1 hypothetical protein PRIPAC_31004 [Pristionchus pacificus]
MDCASVILGMFVGAFAVAIFALLINLICKRPMTSNLSVSNFRYPAHLVRTRPPTPSPRYFDVIVENSQNPTAHDNFLTAFPPQTQLQTPSQ